MERLQFEKIDNDRKVICEVIATYHDDDTNKDFMVYTDNSFDKEGKLKIYYSLYKKVGNNIELIEPKTIEDKEIGLELIKELLSDIKES